MSQHESLEHQQRVRERGEGAGRLIGRVHADESPNRAL